MMKIDFNQIHPPPGAVLDVRGVHIAANPPYDAAMHDVSFSIQPGELVLIYLDIGTEEHPLADLISGLIQPEAGDLRIFGHGWSQWSPDIQARARSKIGRVFAGQGWISNLDVDENVTIAERHHTRRPLDEIHAEAKMLAHLAGLAAIPQTRPPVTDQEELRRAEWVRAALGSPWLMVMERPGFGLAEGWLAPLKQLIQHVRSRGTAIIWMCDSEDEWNDVSLNPSLKLNQEGNKLTRVL